MGRLRVTCEQSDNNYRCYGKRAEKQQDALSLRWHEGGAVEQGNGWAKDPIKTTKAPGGGALAFGWRRPTKRRHRGGCQRPVTGPLSQGVTRVTL